MGRVATPRHVELLRDGDNRGGTGYGTRKLLVRVSEINVDDCASGDDAFAVARTAALAGPGQLGESKGIGVSWTGALSRWTRLLLMAVFAVSTLAIAPPSASASHAEATPGVSDSVVRLYWAVFDRAPDPGGHAYWVDQYMHGRSLDDIARLFMESPEWDLTYGDVDDVEFIHLIYRNVMDREPDAEGGQYWLSQMVRGVSRRTVLLNFSESPEFIIKTGTVRSEAPPALFPALPPNSGTGRRIVYSNSRQMVWLVESDGHVSDAYPVSGKRGEPAAGTYSVYSKSPKAWAGHDGITMDHMVRFAWGAELSIGFHSIPKYSDGRWMQTLDQLGTFRSAGCVRQDPSKAAALYWWAPVGTKVVVTP